MKRFEPAIEWALFLCALLSIGTTIGIIVVLAVETWEFLREVPIAEFLFGTEWTPLFAMPRFGVLPLVIGIGVTNGIQILNRFAEERNPGIFSKSTGKAVLVSGLTAIAGFGSLILAKHRGIESLGFIMAVGVATCMVAGLTFLPAILNVLVRRGWTIKKPSGDNARSTTGSGGTEVNTSITKQA